MKYYVLLSVGIMNMEPLEISDWVGWQTSIVGLAITVLDFISLSIFIRLIILAIASFTSMRAVFKKPIHSVSIRYMGGDLHMLFSGAIRHLYIQFYLI